MKARNLLLAATSVLLLSSVPAKATDFALFGSYWKTDVAGKAGGGGIDFGLPVNDTFGFELRATYFEQLNDDPFRHIFHSDQDVFRNQSLQVLPLEAGVKFNFAPGSTFRPYIGGGASYFLLDSDFGEVKDELGWYGSLGATVGDNQGPQFFFEGIWRKVRAEVRVDPEDLGDIGDINAEDRVSFDLDGFGLNAGIRWTF
ncbi:MAG: hypothetical protein ABI639_03265 [Thermoanaerobaculia bacterium]